MAQEDVRMFPNKTIPTNPIIFNEQVCNGCNNCVEVCVTDILMPNPEKGKPPIMLYPDECWYDGLCVSNCPLWQKGAITFNLPLDQKVRWKKKATGEHFRIGMLNPPAPNTRPPAGGWKAIA